MNVYPVYSGTQQNPGQQIGELVLDMALPTYFWPNLTPAGDGNIYTGGSAPSPAWSQVPNFLNETASLNVNIATTYVTPTTGVTIAVAAGFVLPSGWAFDGTHLTYDGTTVNSSATNIKFTAKIGAGASVLSNQFQVQGSGAPATDTLASIIPTGLKVVTNTASTITFTCDPVSDPNPAATVWSGVQGYKLLRAGSVISTTASGGAGPQVAFTSIVDRGGSWTESWSQSGADITLTSNSHYVVYPTQDGFSTLPYAITGTSWVCTWKIPASFQPVDAFANARMLVTPTPSNNTSACISVCCSSLLGANGNGAFVEARASSGGNAVQIASLPKLTTGPVWFKIVRATDTYTFFGSTDGNAWQPMGTATQVMGSTVSVCPAIDTHSGTSITAVFQQFNLSNLSAPTLTDSSPLGTTQNYSVESYDLAATPNVSAAGNTISVAPAGATIRWHPGHYLASDEVIRTPTGQSAHITADINFVNTTGSNVLGYAMNILWSQLETSTKGVYDFSQITNVLSALNSSKLLIVNIGTGYQASDPSEAIPTYILNDPTYGSSPVAGKYGYWTSFGGGQCEAATWRAAVGARINALMTALGATFDGNTRIEAFCILDETAVGGNMDSGNDFSEAAYRTYYQNLNTAAKAAFPHTNFGGAQVNYTTGDISETNCPESINLIDDMYKAKVAIGWPDTYGNVDGPPNFVSWGQSGYLGNGGGAGFVYAGKMACIADVQAYATNVLDYTASPATIASFANSTLKVTHLLWWYVGSNGSGQGDWTAPSPDGVQAAINNNPITNTAYPY